MEAKGRVDLLLVQRGLAANQADAQKLLMAGQVRAAGQVVLNPATVIPSDALLQVDPGPPFVSRGGEKLAAALDAFKLDLKGLACVDVGASTGGFTDCLLQRGASRVYALDVGQGVLAWKLRQDERVVVMENTNARLVTQLPGPVSLAVIDVSFISLTTVLPVVLKWFNPGILGEIIALIKPQFEASRQDTSRSKGVIRDAEVHRQVLTRVLTFASQQNCQIRGLIASPLLGPKGNREFLVWLLYPGQAEQAAAQLSALVDSALAPF